MTELNAELADAGDRHTQALATLIHLGRRAREIDNPAELRFLLVNESAALLSFRQAAFWSLARGVEAISGVSEIEKHGPYVQWLNHWFEQLPGGSKIQSFASDLRLLQDQASQGWHDWLPPHVVSVQLPRLGKFSGGRLLLARDEPFDRAELGLLEEWIAAWLDQYATLVKPTWRERLGSGRHRGVAWKRLTRVALLAGLFGLGAVPVPLSVLAPADLIALNPALVRAPMDGVIDQMLIEPNQRVDQGTPLFDFDQVTLNSRYELAKRTLDTAKATYRQNAQLALSNSERKAELAVLRSQIEEKQVEVAYLETLLARSLVKAPQAGIVILDDASEWIGRPVVTGELVLAIADEYQTQIEAWLSPADMVELPEQANLTLFLSADPLRPLYARVSYVAHLPELRPEGGYAYRVRAQLKDNGELKPRLGLQGTARIESGSVALAYWIFRRPWAAIRGWLGV